MATLDVELEMLLVGKAFLDAKPATGGAAAAPDEPLFIAVKFDGDIAGLEAAGFAVGSTIGRVAYGSTTLAGLQALARLPQVESIQRQRHPQLHLDGSVPEIRADLVWGRSGDHFSGYTGQGVIVGVIDTGIDFRHQTFRHADGSTRVVKIWDQTLTLQGAEGAPDPITTPSIASTPTPLGYGVEYNSIQINATLTNASPPVPVRHVDTEGHGTHVCGIAVGDGSQSGHCHGTYRYIGVATDADVIMVRRFGLSKTDKLLTAPATSNSFTIDAIRYIVDQARKLGRPVAINLSFGAFTENMDGTAAECTSVDTLLLANSTGTAIVLSAGNDGDSRFHAIGPVPAGPTATLPLKFTLVENDATKRYLTVLYTGTNLQAQVTSPVAGAAGVVPWVTFAAGSGQSTSANGAGSTVTVSNIANRISVEIAPATAGSNQAGTWTLELKDSGSTATPVDALCLYGSSHDAASARFVDHTTTRSTLNYLATGAEPLSVASHREAGRLSAFSSRGPTLEAVPRPKPDLSAPGEDIASAAIAKDRTCENCCCGCCHDFYVDMSGTSMSAPHVTGVIALMLHKNPSLTHADIKRLLTAAAAPKTPGSTPDEDLGWGAGRLDAKHAVDSVAQVNPPVARVALAPSPLAALHGELLATERGPSLQRLFERYGTEVFGLIQHNRRVATVWHRCRGPTWTRLALRAAHVPDEHLPADVDGLRLGDGLRRFAAALKRYGSVALRDDVTAWEGELARVDGGMTIRELIGALGEPASQPTMAT